MSACLEDCQCEKCSEIFPAPVVKYGRVMKFYFANSVFNACVQQLNGLVNEVFVKHFYESIPVSNFTDAELLEEHGLLSEKITAIETLQNQIRGHRPCFDFEKQRDENALSNFLKWCEDQGIVFNGVKIEASSEGQYSLVATKDITPGEKVLKVPEASFFTCDVAKNSKYMGDTFKELSIFKELPLATLAVSICCERLMFEKSKWKPYLDVLPGRVFNVLLYTTEQLKLISPSPTFRGALTYIRLIRRAYFLFLILICKEFGYPDCVPHMPRTQFGNHVLTPDNFTYSIFQWAVFNVSSRLNKRYDISRGITTENVFLIPAIEMANAFTEPQQLLNVDAAAHHAELTCGLPVAKGKEFLMFYGSGNTAFHFIYSAFVLKNNPLDSLQISISIPRSATLAEKRAKYIIEHNIGSELVPKKNQFGFQIGKSCPMDPRFLQFAKVMLADEITDESINRISDEEALEWVLCRLKLLLRFYRFFSEEECKNNEIHSTIKALHEAETDVLRHVISAFAE